MTKNRWWSQVIGGPAMLAASLACVLSALLSAGPARAANDTVVYAFNGPDGGNPEAGLVNIAGTLYGTTFFGGTGFGTVFKVSPAGVESVLYSFAGGTDGANPEAGLINVGGALYGTTTYGGSAGLGTVFKVTQAGVEKVIYSFAGGNDGMHPAGGLRPVGGALYGTTFSGGEFAAGTVFSVTPAGSEAVIYPFTGGADGLGPASGLTLVGGTLYGTTKNGGTFNEGTVFSVTTSGSESVLHSFSAGADGYLPSGDLIYVGGTFYGTTQAGGHGRGCKFGCGTVFAVTKAGVESVLHAFNKNEGVSPQAGLIFLNGTLYGTATSGGKPLCTGGCGTVFGVTLAGVTTVLHAFTGGFDGYFPDAGLFKLGTRLYGTTYSGGGGTGCGEGGCGIVFSVKP